MEKAQLQRILRAALAVATASAGFAAACSVVAPGEATKDEPDGPDVELSPADDASMLSDAAVDAAAASCDACACEAVTPTVFVAVPSYDGAVFQMCGDAPCRGGAPRGGCQEYCAPQTPLGCVAYNCGKPVPGAPACDVEVTFDGDSSAVSSVGVNCYYPNDPYPDGGCADSSPFTFGRRPEGLAAIATAQGAPLGVFFAGVSYLEAASVDAFLTLHDELAMHGAPPELLAQARRAAGDEVRHARGAAALATRFGALPGEWAERPKITPPPPRSLEAIARENAIEGCVQETWGALAGLWAAERAADPEIRRTLGEHAPDEIRHAELAWSVAAWIRDLLDDDARERVDAAMRDAVDALVASAANTEPHADVVALAGVPAARDAARLAAALQERLWLQQA